MGSCTAQAGRSVLAGAPAGPSIHAGLTSETGNLSCMLHHLPQRVLPLSPSLSSLSPLRNHSPTTIFCPQLSRTARHRSPLPPSGACRASTVQAAVDSSFRGRGWLHRDHSAHSRPFTNHPFTTLPVQCVCVSTGGFLRVNTRADQCPYYAQPVWPVCLRYCFEWKGVITEAGAKRLEGNEVRLLNLFRRHSLLWETAPPPPPSNTASTLGSRPARSKISQQASLKGSVVQQPGCLLICDS